MMDRGLQNVDMLDVEELEKQRDDEQSMKNSDGQEPKHKGLTRQQARLIEDIFETKSSSFTAKLTSQFNNMHLELIRNF